MNGLMGEAEKRAGWRHYTSPVAEVKPLLASSISYTFPAQQVGAGWSPHAECSAGCSA